MSIFTEVLAAILRNVKKQLLLRVTSRIPFRPLACESLENRRVLAVTVQAFTPTTSGFVVELSQQVRAANINLYDNQAGTLGAADITLQGASTGAVKGSVVVEGNTITFVASGGPLAADTYTVRLRSAADGIVDSALGELLDGEYSGSFPSGNGTAGGDFVTTFPVTSTAGPIVNIADSVRGPAQTLSAVSSGQLVDGIPVRITQASGVSSLQMTITYDPDLMQITGATLDPSMPEGSQIEVNTSVSGQVTVALFTLSPLTASSVTAFRLIGSVPQTATYGSLNVIQVSSLQFNGGALTGRSDSAMHIVAFPGDVNGSQSYDTEDARLIARAGVGLDNGFVGSGSSVNFAMIDPILLGDVTGDGGLSPLDASDILRKVIALSTPNLPPLPTQQSPTDIAISGASVAENVATGTLVGTFTSVDADTTDTHTYSLVSGTGDTDNASFTISGNQLLTATQLDFETKSSYSIRVRTLDQTGRSFIKVFTITVTNVNEAPTGLTLSSNTVAENAAAGTVVGTLTGQDADSGSTFAFSLVTGTGSTNNSSFAIVGNELRTGSSFNFESQSSLSVRVRVTDQGGLFTEQVLAISVTNANEAPAAIALSETSFEETIAAGTAVGLLSATDADSSDTHTFTLVTGAGSDDNARFVIDGNQIKTVGTFDFETKNSFTIRVRATDQGGLFVENQFTLTVENVNEAPTALALSQSSILSGLPIGSVVGQLSAQDPDQGDTHTYSLVSGNGDSDNSSFEIVGNSLRTLEVFDFAVQDSYSIRVRATDSDGLNFEQTFTITVGETNVAPTNVSLSNATVPENSASGTVVGDLLTDDDNSSDTQAYTLVTGSGDDDNAMFVVDGNLLKTASSFDFETKSSYTIRVRSTDSGGLFFEKALVITVTNVSEAPTSIVLSNNTVAENAVSGSVIGQFSSVDPDTGDTHSHQLVSGTGDDDNAMFAIDGDDLKFNGTLDFETKSSYSIRVRSTDTGALLREQIFVITVTNVNETPTGLALSSTTISEVAAVGSAVGSLTSTDADAGDTHSYSLVTGTGDDDNGSFVIDGDQLKTATLLDIATKSSYSVRIRSTDAGGLFTDQVFTISITASAAPTAIALSNLTIAEDAASGTVVGNLSTVDADAGDSHTYTLVAGTGDDDNSDFVIDGAQVKSATTLDFETKSSYSIRVRSTDSRGQFVEDIFVITVTNVNESPTGISLSNSSLAENEAAGTTVGQLSSSEPDSGDSQTYTLVAGAGDDDNAMFVIDGDQLKTVSSFNFETQNSYTVRVRSTDVGGLFTEQAFVITVTNVNEEPASIGLSSNTIAEDAALGTAIGQFTSPDPDAGDTHIYTLVSGSGDDDNAMFVIDGDQLKSNTTLDFETKSNYSIRVRSTDAGGLFTEQLFSITVTNVNEAPSNAGLSNTNVSELAPVGTLVGNLTSTDVDAGDTHTYTLVSGTGDDDNADFVIDGSQLKTASTLDFATQSSYSVRIRTTDAAGLFTEQVFAISVVANAAPTSLNLSSATLSDDTAIGGSVGQFTTVDSDALDSHSYTLVSGTGDDDNAAFTIDGDQLKTAITFDAAVKSSYSIRVRTTDLRGLFTESVIAISVTPALS